LVSVWILLIISAVSEAWHLDWNQPVQISKVVAGLLAVPLWVLAAWVDEYVSDRLGYRAERQYIHLNEDGWQDCSGETRYSTQASYNFIPACHIGLILL